VFELITSTAGDVLCASVHIVLLCCVFCCFLQLQLPLRQLQLQRLQLRQVQRLRELLLLRGQAQLLLFVVPQPNHRGVRTAADCVFIYLFIAYLFHFIIHSLLE